MRYVIEYTATDGYTYWARMNIPVEYDGDSDSLLLEINSNCEDLKLVAGGRDIKFKVGSAVFTPGDFDYYEFSILDDISVYTVDDWFDMNKKELT